MPKVSVIAPVYKAEQYLHRCIDSILYQSFTDWEFILVDDGSPDGSGTICDVYVLLHSIGHIIKHFSFGYKRFIQGCKSRVS